MFTTETSGALSRLFVELVDGASEQPGAFVLNPGDHGLLASLDRLSPDEASRSAHGGATIAAHAEHVRYGLSLMNRWAREGGNPFADARWGDAWKITRVDAAAWQEIRRGLRDEAHRWGEVVRSPRPASDVELAGLLASVVHLAYHLGAVRQISGAGRGPREGTSST